MTTSPEEARLSVIEHITAFLGYFMTDDGTPQDQIEDVLIECENIADLLIKSMNMNFSDSSSKNEFDVSVRLEDPIDFLVNLPNQKLVN